ncbi:MAG: CRP-like cAMP-binding protein [Alloalcanivorax sp.]|jgi:CRP/FNR family cyclic AMP-dependent transcriptional regulator
MIPLGETLEGLPALARHYKQLGDAVIRGVRQTPHTLSLPAIADARREGLANDRLYVVRGGTLAACCQGRRLLLWDEGDLIIPDPNDGVTFQADGAVLLAGYNFSDLIDEIASSPELARRWSELLLIQQALLTRCLAALTPEENHTGSRFAYFHPGDLILRQGDRADGVYNLFEGEADVLVDDVVVGRVTEGELLGAIAVLTGAPRGATVRARGRCSAMHIPSDGFHHLIRSKPSLIHGLMTDMARQITELNAQVVTLSGRTP